ncbi:MAG: site-specific DNA-methyltransferase, partial [Deltaproteobacteria bacterium]|nr:site-specific DNA-methyltransferase [Deltaproteobacteria bacterium]
MSGEDEARQGVVDRMSLASADLLGDRLDALRELFPEALTEGKVDLERLRVALGGQVDEGRERYGLTWAGKAEAMRCIQVPSTGTLLPVPAESVDFDTSENVFIEGDNLEVLKLLQKSYYGKVKLIYIDPPYNTGNEFIYPDNFREGLQDYLRYSGQVDGEGIKLSTNTETDGRFHSKWLSMMWPRLFLARNLLRDDGFLCASISDHECAALRFVLNEVFGEENFVAQFVWKSRQFPDDRTLTHVSVDHEYLLVYARRNGTAFLGVGRDESKFANPDEDPRGPWMSRSLLGLATKEQRPNLHYTIEDPATGYKYDPPPETGWRYAKEKMARLIENGCVLFPKKADGRPREKKFRRDITSSLRSIPSIITDVHTSHGTKEIRELFGFQAFDFPKPTELVRTLVEQTTSDDDLILDFFAGSATTGHAVYLQNARDGLRRRFVCVQLPEPTSAGSEAEQRGFPTIGAIGRERLRLAAQTVAKGIAESLDLNHGGIADL